ncbi:carboxypeptidase B-like [Choristoneura fumiferana]|uniref:carboxypeptidase B-like n=1 Tax=Choristoneura fumiferana TaxID=7141 RepID=UPI003D15E50B
MLFLLFLSFVPLAVAKNELYMGYKVYNVKLTSQEQQDHFNLLKSDIIDYWIKPNFKYGVTGLAMLPPSQVNWFEERLEDINIEKDILIDDVYEHLLQYESRQTARIDENDNTDEIDNNNTDESDSNNTDEGDNNNTDEDSNTSNTDEDDINLTVEDDNNNTDEDNNNNTDEDDNNNNTDEDDNNITDEDDNNNTEEEDEDTEKIDESEEDEEINFAYDAYYRYDVILRHIYNLKERYENSPRVSIEVVEFGTTDLGRPLVYLKVTSRTEVSKPIIVIESGINPRQWITIPSALNIVDQILAENEASLLDNFEWIVIPVVNPDGYEYTHTDLRFWEKNLSTKSDLSFICPGVNINRNFDIAWSISDSSSSACSHLYAGVEATSEIETRFLQSIIETYKERISLYISLQNGGRLISYPWQYEFAASGMFRQNHLLGMQMVAALNDGYSLDVASVAIGDRVSGTSSDFARINNALYVFNIDIVGRGEVGVLVPEIDIVYLIEDVWRAVAVAADYLISEINQ